jgi:hypothetical protein
MGGGGTNTTTTQQVSAPTNPDVQATASKLAQGISAAYDRGPSVFNESTFSPAGATTQDAWAKAIGAANDPAYMNGVKGAIGYAGNLARGSGPSLTETNLMDVANGKYLGQTDPNYQAAVDRAANGLAADVNASIGADGRYGSNVHVNALGDQIGALRTNAAIGELNTQRQRQMDALSAIEGTRQQGVNNAFAAQSALPALFSAEAAPSAAIGAVGSAMDANSQGILSGRYDLATRQGNAWNDLIARLTSAAAGNAANTGVTTTSSQTTPTTPWYLSLAGMGLQAL